MRFPSPLRDGSRIALVAPSGPLRDPADLVHAVANVESLGWRAIVGDHVLERNGYLAGTDRQRVDDFNHFASNHAVDAIWCLRGGYGAMRLLDDIDYGALVDRPRPIIGYSDITALHAAIGKRANLVTFHGPTARGDLTALTRASFVSAMTDRASARVVAQGDMTTLRGGTSRGRLTGGNLALVAALIGTPYAFDLDGAILVLEDVSESVYRIDRMLMQIALSGGLSKLAGICFGRFTDIPDDPTNADRSIEMVLAEFAARAGVPCVRNFPIGHVADHVTLPLGAEAELDADAQVLTIHISHTNA